MTILEPVSVITRVSGTWIQSITNISSSSSGAHFSSTWVVGSGTGWWLLPKSLMTLCIQVVNCCCLRDLKKPKAGEIYHILPLQLEYSNENGANNCRFLQKKKKVVVLSSIFMCGGAMHNNKIDIKMINIVEKWFCGLFNKKVDCCPPLFKSSCGAMYPMYYMHDNIIIFFSKFRSQSQIFLYSISFHFRRAMCHQNWYSVNIIMYQIYSEFKHYLNNIENKKFLFLILIW